MRYTLGVRYFKELAAWLTAEAESLNQKFGSEALTVAGEGAQHVLNIVSHPNAKTRWSAQLRYTPSDGTLDIFRNPGGSTPYMIALAEGGSKVVALLVSDAGAKQGIEVEALGQNILQSMLILS